MPGPECSSTAVRRVCEHMFDGERSGTALPGRRRPAGRAAPRAPCAAARGRGGALPVRAQGGAVGARAPTGGRGRLDRPTADVAVRPRGRADRVGGAAVAGRPARRGGAVRGLRPGDDRHPAGGLSDRRDRGGTHARLRGRGRVRAAGRSRRGDAGDDHPYHGPGDPRPARRAADRARAARVPGVRGRRRAGRPQRQLRCRLRRRRAVAAARPPSWRHRCWTR